jgi:hypothetical protein
MRQQLQLLLLIGLVLALGVVGYQVLFGERPAYELVVVSARDAELVSGTEGERVPIKPGMVVDVDNLVETGGTGMAALKYGSGAELMLSPMSSMRVLSTGSKGIRVELDAGAVSARIRPGSPPLSINNRGRAVGATDADFTVMVSRGGPLSVASRRGAVSLQGFPGAQRLEAGSVVHAPDGKLPEFSEITESLLFEVEWPEKPKTREAEVELTGTTDPYATVTLGSGPQAVRVRADRDGRFRATVSLAEGENEIELKVRDVTGRVATQTQSVRRDSTAPVIQAAEVLWGQ